MRTPLLILTVLGLTFGASASTPSNSSTEEEISTYSLCPVWFPLCHIVQYDQVGTADVPEHRLERAVAFGLAQLEDELGVCFSKLASAL